MLDKKCYTGSFMQNKKIINDQAGSTDKLFTILCIDDESANLKILAAIFKNNYKIIIK